MQRLFLFLYKYRAFLTFLFLEALCIWFIVQNNNYQSAKYFNSSNRISANLLATSRGISDYFNLKEVNTDLAEENANLRRQLEQLEQSLYNINVRQRQDDELLNQYEFIPAKVIKNSTRKFENYITINKGTKHGIEPGMAVINNNGVVGKVKEVSRNFSVIISILHGNSMVSSKIKRTGDLCTVKWDGEDYLTANVLYLPRHVNLTAGDTIVTSGYNAIFPEGIPVGTIESFEISEDALFYDADIKLSTDLNRLSYVYLIKNNLKVEQDSIESLVN
ncbi:rod shape-determining protein MreC [Fulvivirga lutea]|uniref:Cell shape-determining protein MreC n=1 Tax=Fulvivirga lutea TaxID=2810512 RepID=A0A974WIJ5_9BACT|nr:rod shape-determining protein MreC [Fulvivirga lutea]QSE97802.1 rod shape-determining protein MreC [Fulvivirga lutea]